MFLWYDLNTKIEQQIGSYQIDWEVYRRKFGKIRKGKEETYAMLLLSMEGNV